MSRMRKLSLDTPSDLPKGTQPWTLASHRKVPEPRSRILAIGEMIKRSFWAQG